MVSTLYMVQELFLLQLPGTMSPLPAFPLCGAWYGGEGD